MIQTGIGPVEVERVKIRIAERPAAASGFAFLESRNSN
jgi:hypothetical protein